METLEQLEAALSEPTAGVVETMRRLDGDLVLLGVAGKMGPSLARMAKRATEMAGKNRRIFGVARFSSAGVEEELRRAGIDTLSCDLLDEAAVRKLPDAPNVVYLAGMKFGSTGQEPLTWAMNTYLPSVVCRRYPQSRIVAFSTGNVYGLTTATSSGSAESDALAPVGEYAMSCLGRERIFEHFSRSKGTLISIIRLNYACDLRYGVLVDLAQKIRAGVPIDLGMGWFNIIWQGDANAMALQAFAHAASPPFVLNVTGPERLRVRDVCEQLGALLGRKPVFTGTEGADALLSNAQRAFTLYGRPRVAAGQLLEWVAAWVRRGGPTLNKATHFEARGREVLTARHLDTMRDKARQELSKGLVIPACPLALNGRRGLDERRQRALIRYYAAAGAGGVAVGVHTTQFAIREPRFGLFRPVLQLAAEELARQEARCGKTLVRIGGICGPTPQAISEAQLLREFGYDAGLLSLAALRDATEDGLITHCRTVAEIVPILGFYLQPAVGGRVLSYSFWRRFVEVPGVVAIKVAPFNRYQTLDVLRAVAESGRPDLTLYTGNDDNIVLDLLTPYQFQVNGRPVEVRIKGGLLGHWSVWTQKAVQLFEQCRRVSAGDGAVGVQLLREAMQITDCNAAFFDAANAFAGCIAGLHEVLRRQGLFEGTWCLDPDETLSPGQIEEIDRVYANYPHLNDDGFVRQHREEWLNG